MMSNVLYKHSLARSRWIVEKNSMRRVREDGIGRVILLDYV